MLEFNMYPERLPKSSVRAESYLFLGPFDIKELTDADEVPQQLQHKCQSSDIRESSSFCCQSAATGDLSEIEPDEIGDKEAGSCNRRSIGYRMTIGAPIECKAGHIPMEVYEWREKVTLSSMYDLFENL